MCIGSSLNNSKSESGNQSQNGAPQNGNREWVLCGHINLHKSPECATQLVLFLNYALQSASLNDKGEIDMNYPPFKRGTVFSVTMGGR